MTATEQGRGRLWEKLREVLGKENAGILIEMLPRDHDQLATMAAVERLESRMDGRMDGLESRIDGLEKTMERFDQRLWEFHEALRAQTRIYATIVVTAMLGVGSLSFAAAALL